MPNDPLSRVPACSSRQAIAALKRLGAYIGRLMERYRDEKSRMERMEVCLRDTALHLRNLADGVENELAGERVIEVADTKDALFLNSVRLPGDALRTLGEQLDELDALRKLHSETRLMLSNQGIHL